MRAVARQATKGLLLRLRPYRRPRSGLRVVAPRQPHNQAKHNPIKYDAQAFAFFLTNIGFTPRTSIFSVNACGRLRAQDPYVLPIVIYGPMERRI